MVDTSKTSSGDAAAHKTGERPPDPGARREPVQLPNTFVPNEPTHKSGLSDENKPDGTLSPKQLERAATEALLSLRPQPSKVEIRNVLNKLAEVDEKGRPKCKVKTAQEAANKAVEALNGGKDYKIPNAEPSPTTKPTPK